MSLSAIVITKNEEAMIRRCLQSVAWADEIVVVDSGSTDATPQICRELGAKVHVTADWPGPGPQRNRAIDWSSGDWVLALDADDGGGLATIAGVERPGIVHRLDRDTSGLIMVARNDAERRSHVYIGENSCFSGLYVDDEGRLAEVAPDLRNEDLAPTCPCCTHTFNGVPLVRPYAPPQSRA